MLGIMEIMWIVFSVVILATGLIFVLMVAGKEMIFGFKKFFNKKGCFAFIVNQSKFVSVHYLTPKALHFRITDNIYATNPDKCLDLEEKYLTKKEKDKIKKSIEDKQNRILKRIEALQNKKEAMLHGLNLEALESSQKEKYLRMVAPIDEEINKMEKKLDNIDTTDNYYFKSKPAFFYIEGDPVPKDFFELYTELDSKIIDNLAARAASSSANMQQQKTVDLLKWLVIGAAIAAAAAAFLAFRNQTMIQALMNNAGVTVSI